MLMLLLLGPGLMAQSRIRLFTVRDGLSQNSVTAIFRDRDGFLWVGTQDGLNRFDGYGFIQYRHDPLNPESISDQYITAIGQDLQGNLWVGTRNGLNLFNPANGSFSRLYPDPTQKKVIQNPVYRILALSDGDILIAISGRMFRRSRVSGIFSPLQVNFEYTANISVVKDAVWQVWSPAHVCQLLPVREHDHDDSILRSYAAWKVRGQEIDPSGVLWSFHGTGPGETALRRYDMEKRQWIDQPSILPALVSTIAFTADGEPWIGTDKGIYRRNGRGVFYRWVPEGVPQDSKVLSIHAGADGLLWIGFANNGIGRIDPEERVFRTVRTGINDPVFAGHETADGKLLIAAQSGLYQADSTGMRLDRLLSMKVSAVTVDATGRIWAGTDQRGVFILDGSGRVRRNLTMERHGLTSNNIFQISTQPSGKRVFISAESGLTVMEGEQVLTTMFGQQEDGTPSRLAGNYVIHSQTDSRGNLWVSTNMGINVFDADLKPVRSINSAADTSRYIRRTIITGTTEGMNGERWISTLSGGVYRMTGDRFENFRSVNGLSSDVAYGVVTDHLGRAWVATTRGVSVIDPADSSIYRLTEDDGLPATDFSLACITKGPSGKIMIGSQQGLVIADPSKFRKPGMNPKVFLESAQVNYNPVPLATDYRLEPSGAAVTFRFTAPVFKNAGQIMYQYRVNGLVDRWVTLRADNRVVSLTSLPYRSLVLEVRAGLDSRSIADSPLTRIAIERLPPWWRNPWVYIPISFALFGAVVLQIRQRIRRKLEATIRKAELDRSLAAERERLSRDLHDRLGAYAAAIKSNINQLERAEALDTGALDRLKKNAEEMVTALRETIWALKQEKVAITGISDRIKSYVNRIAPDFPQVHIQVTEQPALEQHASPAEAIHLMAIIQEALTNALRHSGCTSIEISFLAVNGFRVSISDNGRGLGADNNGEETGYGLRNMRQRAAESGFFFDISGTDQGTTVTITQGVAPA